MLWPLHGSVHRGELGGVLERRSTPDIVEQVCNMVRLFFAMAGASSSRRPKG